jgi:hypothetical protein
MAMMETGTTFVQSAFRNHRPISVVHKSAAAIFVASLVCTPLVHLPEESRAVIRKLFHVPSAMPHVPRARRLYGKTHAALSYPAATIPHKHDAATPSGCQKNRGQSPSQKAMKTFVPTALVRITWFVRLSLIGNLTVFHHILDKVAQYVFFAMSTFAAKWRFRYHKEIKS